MMNYFSTLESNYLFRALIFQPNVIFKYLIIFKISLELNEWLLRSGTFKNKKIKKLKAKIF